MEIELLTFGQAASLLPRRPSPATWWRWVKKGVRGVRLATVVVGGRRYVTRRSLEEFVAQTTAASGTTSPAIDDRRRHADRQRAQKTLEQAGIRPADRRQRGQR